LLGKKRKSEQIEEDEEEDEVDTIRNELDVLEL
jgi:hypothetical protein